MPKTNFRTAFKFAKGEFKASGELALALGGCWLLTLNA